MYTEILTALEAFKLLKRNPLKYVRGVGGMYLLSAKGTELGRIARACFFFFRNIDDALDGDRKEIKDPLSHVLNCRKQIESGEFKRNPKIISLAKFAIEKLQKNSNTKEDPKQIFLDEIDVILFDHQRAKRKKILTKKKLNEYYKKTFIPVINLLLIALNSKLRAKDILELTFCQGIVYTIRDLDVDWNRGVINLPREILKKAKLTGKSSIQHVKTNPIIKSWFRKELLKCQKDLIILDKKLVKNNESLTTALCRGLMNPLFKLNKQYLAV